MEELVKRSPTRCRPSSPASRSRTLSSSDGGSTQETQWKQCFDTEVFDEWLTIKVDVRL